MINPQAILAAISFAIERNAVNIVLEQEDFVRGARQQLQGHLSRRDTSLDSRIVPQRVGVLAQVQGLGGVILPDEVLTDVMRVVAFEKARKVKIDPSLPRSCLASGDSESMCKTAA